jgi:hypothetical protein
MALVGDLLVVGEPEWGTGGLGKAYAYARSGASWSQTQELVAFGSAPQDGFAESIAMTADTLVIGASGGDPPGLTDPGAAYVFRWNSMGSTWDPDTVLTACDGVGQEQLGAWVAVSGDRVAAGAPFDDGGLGIDAGAAYVYTRAPVGSGFCFGDGGGTPCPCGNAGCPYGGCGNGTFGGGCILTAGGDPTVGSDSLVLLAAQATPGQPGLFFQGQNAVGGGAGAQFGDGLRCAGMNVVRLQVVTADMNGDAATSLVVSVKGGVSSGDMRHYQFWYRDPAVSPCGATFNLSNGLTVAWL